MINDATTVAPLHDSSTCAAGPADWEHVAPYLVDYTQGTSLIEADGTLTTSAPAGAATWEPVRIDGKYYPANA
ncbi:hypothetical protein [Luteimicrobium subarcticum]|uniref:Uncharacterized protein n=1 Tax=Luteimicrobium subarcticum TaxID=620910 RepID=A0A2M8W739_9MICO|nr:hypothetical protein [Luteimicrobium subarcticum]PJI86719.1 hypothetical protein CLV34_2639 [Luteimicrobium subarcticum]